jgi:hypothetical protein
MIASKLKKSSLFVCRGAIMKVLLIIIALCAHIGHCQVSQGSLDRQRDGKCSKLPPNSADAIFSSSSRWRCCRDNGSSSLQTHLLPQFYFLNSLSAVQILLIFRSSIENWAEYAQANKIQGWSNAIPVCTWSGISCTDTGDIASL